MTLRSSTPVWACVGLRISATDSQGNTVKQTLPGAYELC